MELLCVPEERHSNAATPRRRMILSSSPSTPRKASRTVSQLVSGNNKISVVIVPDPITAKDKGCTLSVERLLPHFELAFFTGSGFPPNSEVSFESKSYDEKHPINAKTDTEGNLGFIVMPFLAGRHKSTTTVEGTGAICSPSIEFEWGG
jgi:hypothetical protein